MGEYRAGAFRRTVLKFITRLRPGDLDETPCADPHAGVVGRAGEKPAFTRLADRICIFYHWLISLNGFHSFICFCGKETPIPLG